MKYLSLILLFFLLVFLKPSVALASELSGTQNNKFGIHVLSGTSDETLRAASLVNSSGGDWGWVVLLLGELERDQGKDAIQNIFNDLRRKHLIPVVRLTTKPEGSVWLRPKDDEAEKWAQFLDSLIWPVKNRYVIVYNEPNHGNEWGGGVSPSDYARFLNKTIDALKTKNDDFFVLNAGFDSSAPQKLPDHMDELKFLLEMDKEIPGIFKKIDGWVSHSYPNPEFSGSPFDVGRTSIQSYKWEQKILEENFGVKNLPVFITETGWQHAEGEKYEPKFKTAKTVADYFKIAFEQVWNDKNLVMIAPFLLSYDQPPFDHFSFLPAKNFVMEAKSSVLGVTTNSESFPQFESIKSLPKQKGDPRQDNIFEFVSDSLPHYVVSGQTYQISITVKNIGQSVWGDKEGIELKPIVGTSEFGLLPVGLEKTERVEPLNTKTFDFQLTVPNNSGKYNLGWRILATKSGFFGDYLMREVIVEEPVVLNLQTSLGWKNNHSGENYSLQINRMKKKLLEFSDLEFSEEGKAGPLVLNELLPELDYELELSKPSYVSASIKTVLKSGDNLVQFSALAPFDLNGDQQVNWRDFLNAFSKPQTVWSLMPWVK